MARAKHIPLNLAAFEERINPATATFLNGTLTIVPTTDDSIIVNLNASPPFSETPGFLEILEGVTTIFSSSAAQKVDNIQVNGSSAANFTFLLSPKVSMTNLTINGGVLSTVVNLFGSNFSGGFTFNGTGVGNDTINLTGFNNNGSAKINLGDGSNTLNFIDGTVGGDFTVNSGRGDDNIALAQSVVTVGGSMALSLGDGSNQVTGLSASTISVGKNFSLTGGSGTDALRFDLLNTSLAVGGSFSANLKEGPGPIANNIQLSSVFVGDGMTILGGNSGDQFIVLNGATIGGDLVFSGLGGLNVVQTKNLNVGGSLTTTGAGGSDYIQIEGSTIHGNISVALGNDNGGGVPLNFPQQFAAGITQPNLIGGSVTVTGGNQTDLVRILQTTIQKNLSLNTLGGDDTVTLTAFTADGYATINLGSDNNKLTFNDGKVGGDFNVISGGGNDLVFLAQGAVTVNGNMALTLGDGFNQVVSLASSVINVSKNFRFAGGSGDDFLDFNNSFNSTTLNVGGNFYANLKSGSIFGNAVILFKAFIGGNMNFLGGNSIDIFNVSESATIGGDLVFSGLGGVNRFQASSLNVGGSVSVTGSGGTDFVQINDSSIHQNLTVALGNDDGSGGAVGLTQNGLLMQGANVIGGNLIFTGGAQDDLVDIKSSVGKKVMVNTLGGNDTVVLTSFITAGSVIINLGADSNTLNFNDGKVGGDFTAVGGSGADTVNLTQNPVTVNGTMALTLGDGINQVNILTSNVVNVSKNFSFTGGNGRDVFNLGGASGIRLLVGGNFTTDLKTAPVGESNFVSISDAHIGGSMQILGGNSADLLIISRGATIGGDLVFTGSGGINLCDLNNLTVGGSASMTGGFGCDSISINASTIHQNLTVMLGNDDGGGIPFNIKQALFLGNTGENRIGGNLTVTGGRQADSVVVQRTKIGKNLSLNTLDGIDTVEFDDLDVTGFTNINLGAGSDILKVDTNAALTLATQFTGDFTVNGGTGDDLFDFSFSSGGVVRFGGIVKIVGDAGNDTLQNFVNNSFILPASRFEDCEVGTF